MSSESDPLTRLSVHPAAPVLLTKIGPLGLHTLEASCPFKRQQRLTHLKFENKLRAFRPQGF
jgi:hypothetical protein